MCANNNLSKECPLKTHFLTPVLTSLAIVLMAIGCDRGPTPKNSEVRSKERANFFEPIHDEEFINSDMIVLSDAYHQQILETHFSHAGERFVDLEFLTGVPGIRFTVSYGTGVIDTVVTGTEATLQTASFIRYLPRDAEITLTLLDVSMVPADNGNRNCAFPRSTSITYVRFDEGGIRTSSSS